MAHLLSKELIKKEKRRGIEKPIFGKIRQISIYRIRGLPVFIGKNSKALKRRKHKGFCVFLLYGSW